MKILIACILCMFCGCLCAKENKSLVDTQILAHYVKDWGKTRISNKSCQSAENHHDISGTCPSAQDIDVFFLTSALLHMGALKVLPNRYSRYLDNSKLNLNAHIHESYSSLEVQVKF